MKPRINPFLRQLLALTASSVFLCLGSAHAATYTWDGSGSNTDSDNPDNWVGNTWAQWNDYEFTGNPTTGNVNVAIVHGWGNITLGSGLTKDIVIGGSESIHMAPANPSGWTEPSLGGTITIASGSKNLTVNTGFNIAGTLNLNVGTGRTLTANGGIQNWIGTAALNKQGEGTVILAAANGYTGTTTISAGTLQVGNGTDAGSITSSSGITNDGALVYNVGSGNRTYANVISGTGTLTQNSSGGTLTLTGLNTYTGGTTVTAGTLTLGNGGPVGVIRNSLTINSGATVSASAEGWSLGYENGTSVTDITLNGGTLNFTGATNAGGTTASAITFSTSAGIISGTDFDWYNDITNTPTLTVTAAASGSEISSGINLRLTSSGTLTMDVADGANANDMLISGVIRNGVSGAGAGIIKSGAGTLTFSAANTYTGTTTISDGTLQLSGSGTLGSGVVSLTGGTLDLGGTTQTLGNNINATGAGNGAVGTITNGTINLNGKNAYLKSGTFTMDLTGSGNSRLWIGGDSGATVELGGTNTSTYSDNSSTIIGLVGTTGAAGTVKLLSATALGPASQTTQVHSGTLDLNGQTGITVERIALNGTSNLVNSNTGTAAS